MTDFQNRAVTSSRASESKYINKSGIVSTADEDEAIITSDGIGIFESFTNELPYSEDSSTNWTSTYASLSEVIYNDQTWVEVTEDTTENAHTSNFSGSAVSVTSGDTVSLQYFVHKDSTRDIAVRIATDDDGQIARATLSISDGTLSSITGTATVDDWVIFTR